MLGGNFSQYNELIGSIYDGIDHKTPWASFLDGLTAVMKARDSSIVMVVPNQVGSSYNVTTSDTDPRLTHQYLDGVFSVNFVMDMPQPQPATIDELMPREEFRRTPLYQKFLAPIGVEYMLGVDVINNEDLHIKLAIERTREQGQFGDEEKELLSYLIPHFQRALRLREKSHTGTSLRSLYLDTVAKMAIGCVILDNKGQVLYTNRCADDIIREKVGIKLVNDRLCATDDVRNSQLRDAINLALAAHQNRCTSQKGQGFRLTPETSGRAMDVVVKPLFTDVFQNSARIPAAIIYLHQCEDSQLELDPVTLANIYGFTKKEAALSALIARGYSLAEAAESLDVSINTVKTHLRGIYEKMGTNKQTQVVARLNESCARLL